MNILFNHKTGLPLAVTSEKLFAMTSDVGKTNEEPRDTFSVGSREFVSWGSANRYPDEAVRVIGRTGVLSTAVGFKARTSFGQGVVAYRFGGYDEKGDEVLQPLNDAEVSEYLNSYKFLRYADRAFRDLFKFGNAFPIYYFNEKGDIVNIIARNARHCRISKDKRFLCVYPDFDKHEPSDREDCEIIPMLDEDDPFLDLMTRKALGKINFKRPLAFPRIQNYYSNTDYYGIPDWDAAWRSGWIDVANMVPTFLKESYNNAMTMMWHIKVPLAWYEKHFPESNYASEEGGIEKREQDIDAFWKEFEDKMCGTAGGNKTFMSEYGLDPDSRGEDKWVIERLENEIDAKERLNTSAAANSEILFSMMINPSTLGAGMPGGAYAGNAGSGSDIRESYLVSVITTFIEKQQVMFPVRLALEYNGKGSDIRLKYRETILTTLNTGNSTAEETT